MATTKSTTELLNWLYKEFELSSDDVFIDKNFKIISRTGVEKIMKRTEIKVKYEPVLISADYCCIKAYGETKDGKTVETFGSAELKNVKNSGKYYAEMAEKRAKSRAVLMLAGLYDEGIYGEEESDDFKEALKNRNKIPTPSASVAQKPMTSSEAVEVKPITVSMDGVRGSAGPVGTTGVRLDVDYKPLFANCNSVDAIAKVWEDNKDLQSLSSFKMAATARRIDIQTQKAAA